MKSKGFNSDNIISKEKISSPNFNKITVDFFQWLIWAMESKLKLESIYRFNDNFNEPEIEDSEGEEGGKILIEHLRTEKSKRNNKIVALKKDKAYKEGNGHIKCECCSFDFKFNYGFIGDKFIECHHLLHISEGERITKLEDLSLVCSNCHRMLHKKNMDGNFPTIQEIKRLLTAS
jgi:predicted HNH restriction endonuclease